MPSRPAVVARSPDRATAPRHPLWPGLDHPLWPGLRTGPRLLTEGLLFEALQSRGDLRSGPVAWSADQATTGALATPLEELGAMLSRPRCGPVSGPGHGS